MTFTVPGKPIPKARPRVMRGGWTFTPKKTKDYETFVAYHAIAAMPRDWKINSLYSLGLLFFGSHPRSDFDNLAKAVSDALNGVVWKDDCQVIEATIRKLTCPKGQERTEVIIEEVYRC